MKKVFILKLRGGGLTMVQGTHESVLERTRQDIGKRSWEEDER